MDRNESEILQNITVCVDEQFSRISSCSLAFSEFNAPAFGDLGSRLTRLEKDISFLATLSDIISLPGARYVSHNTSTTEVTQKNDLSPESLT